MDRRRIAELRIMLIKAAAGGDADRAHEDLLVEVRSNLGELLALADAALRIRDVYNRLIGGEGVLDYFESRSRLIDVVRSSMKELDALEEAAREAR
jgi:hypothetical protein